MSETTPADPDSGVVVKRAFFSRYAEPGPNMPDPQKAGMERARRICDDFNDNDLAKVFDWGSGDFNNGQLEYMYDLKAREGLGTIPHGENLLFFACFPSGGYAVCVRANGEVKEFDMVFRERENVVTPA